MRIGSAEHREAFCQLLLRAHESYEASELDWPKLSSSEHGTLAKLPIWAAAIGDEGDTGCMQERFASTIEDDLIREAIAVQANEERRHSQVFRMLLERYEIPLPQVAEPRSADTPLRAQFIAAGYRECMDVTLGYGFYRTARRAKLFPESLFEIFDRFLSEETRHTVFFVNWMAHNRRTGDRASAPWAPLVGYASAAARLFRAAGTEPSHYARSNLGRYLGAATAGALLRDCVDEHELRMREVPTALLKPNILPVIFQLLTIPLCRLKLP